MHQIPKADEVRSSILSTLNKYREIRSKQLLHAHVLKMLKINNQFYTISQDRVKRIAANMPEVLVSIENRKSHKEPKKCYICSNLLDDIKAKDLFGKPTKFGKKCPKCGFKIDKKMLVPKRYIFFKR
jgi:transcription initiation factor IIE alpha subunit|tara:strand:- start:39 stop:419 length:381 start_codon:yes stop_codon:yes gene_type:complete